MVEMGGVEPPSEST